MASRAKKLPVFGITEFTEDNRQYFFYANDLRRHLESHQFINPPHRHSTYITILFTKGTGLHQVDFVDYQVRPGAVFLLKPGQVHCWKLSDDVEGTVFFHTGDFYDNQFVGRKLDDLPFFYLQSNYPLIYLEEREQEAVAQMFRLIREEFRSGLLWSKAKLASLVGCLYIDLARLYKEEQKGHVPISTVLKARRLLKLIDQYFASKKFPVEYAELMNVSSRHLNRLCQEAFGKSTSDLIAERVVAEAKRLLIHVDVPVTTVAEELGFMDDSYFVKFFKKRVGLSPKRFQKRGE